MPKRSSELAFGIDRILYGAGNEDGQQAQITNPSAHIRLIDAEEDEPSPRFHDSSVRLTYILENLDDIPEPEELLKKCFEETIQTAIGKAKAKGQSPDAMNIIITSENLETDIVMNFKKITENTADATLNRFMYVNQSRRSASLLHAPFKVSVTTIDKKKLAKIAGGHAPTEDFYPPTVKQNSLIRINNTRNNYCLFLAVELTRIHVSKEMPRMKFRRFLQNEKAQEEYIVRMLEAADIPLDLAEYSVREYVPILQQFYDKVHTGRYKIFVYTSPMEYKPSYKPAVDKYQETISIYAHREHFDGIRNINSFFGKRHYCFQCESTYTHAFNHKTKCPARCILCTRVGPEFPCKVESCFIKECEDCNKIFYNPYCYDYHKQTSVCDTQKQCPRCYAVYHEKYLKKNGVSHQCEFKFCRRCMTYHHRNSHCYIRTLKNVKKKPYCARIFDFETTPIPEEKKQRHKVNFVSVHSICERCIDTNVWHMPIDPNNPCEICGPYRTVTFSPFPFKDTAVDQMNVAEDPLVAFCDWLVLPENNKFRNILIAHNGGRFDHQFVFNNFYKKGCKVKLLAQGNRIYNMKVFKKGVNLVFRDSYNLLPVKLAGLPASFGLKDVKHKDYYPYLYNKPDNYITVLEHLPPKEDYLCNAMKPKDREKFLKYYEDHYNEPFDFNEKLAEYGCNDTQILTSAIVAAQKIFFKITGLNIIESNTVASFCMKHFRTSHLKKDHLAIVPENNYTRRHNQSKIALKFLKWLEKDYEKQFGKAVHIQTAESLAGEKKIGRYQLDGYIERFPDTNTPLGIEVNGCVWHGCPTCYPDDQTMLHHGITAGEQRKLDVIRSRNLNFVLNKRLLTYWECEIRRMLKEIDGMKEFFDTYQDTGPINAHECFSGGMTLPFQMHAKADDDFKIEYVDFTSLYPFVNFKTEYPVGHPKLIDFNGKQESYVQWTAPDHVPYKGLLKVEIRPPRGPYTPILALKHNHRLLFPSCYKCVLLHPVEGERLDDCNCTHTDEERKFIWQGTHIELQYALSLGYEVRRLYHVWQYEKWDTDLFASYVRDFMQIKIQASGWPEDVETDEQKQAFIEENNRVYGIQLDPTLMIPNPGLCYNAKLCLNSLWGRFALRNTLAETKIITNGYELNELLSNPRIEVQSCLRLDDNDNSRLVKFVTKEEFIQEHDTSNLVVALWTTASARIKLHEKLRIIEETPECSLLYCDTDSIVYQRPRNGPAPLATGTHLGELTNEYPNHEILEWICTGGKQYSMELLNLKTNNIEHVMKLRGITFDHDTSQQLTYDLFKEMGLAYQTPDARDPITFGYKRIRADRFGHVYTQDAPRSWRPKISKANIVNKTCKLVNFGYISHK